MPDPEYTVTVTFRTTDQHSATIARNKLADWIGDLEELPGHLGTLVELDVDLDPGKPGETYVGQLATAVADELERRKPKTALEFHVSGQRRDDVSDDEETRL